MDSFAGKLAVVTGGGSGMGRELVIKLAAQGCAVAACDVRQAAAEETAALARAVAPDGTTVTAHACDVADEAQVARFRDEALAAHGAGNHGAANHVDLVFSNAGTGGAGSFINDPPEMWERVFAVDFWGVYHCARVFLPLLMKSPEGVLVNTSSVNGFWASLGAGIPHTAYSTAKFAVKGFSEALIEDLRISAPHVRVVLVMPGHVATNIVTNSLIAFGVPEKDAMEAGQGFYDTAPLSAAGAADVILDGVLSGAWRVLVGEDAHRLDQYVRTHPEDAYNYEKMSAVLSGSLSEDPARFGADWLGDDVPRPGQVP
jgi:NAD(P)-dependent dehydrogenase (short-subunit alcohol dehydrogenase family)